MAFKSWGSDNGEFLDLLDAFSVLAEHLEECEGCKERMGRAMDLVMTHERRTKRRKAGGGGE